MTAPLASFDPAALGPAERDALQRLMQWRHIRRRGGYVAPGEARGISLATAGKLRNKQLATAVVQNGKPVLALTGAGRMVAAVLEGRAGR